MATDVSFEITTGRLRLRAGPLRLPIPAVLQVAVRAVERAVANAIHVDLVVTHPVLGAIFGYDGTFAVRCEALDASRPETSRGLSLDWYRPWFYAAAGYNMAWGAIAILWPSSFFEVLRLPPPHELAIWQALGTMVLVYAPAYWWVARDPVGHRHLLVIALLGKILGPLGFLWALSAHTLPAPLRPHHPGERLLLVLTNTQIWVIIPLL